MYFTCVLAAYQWPSSPLMLIGNESRLKSTVV